MLIQVRWKNKLCDYVDASQLDNLIDNGWVSGFRRSSGWVTVGVDPVRSRHQTGHYQGIERRICCHAEICHDLFEGDREETWT